MPRESSTCGLQMRYVVACCALCNCLLQDFEGHDMTLQQYYDAAPFTFVDPNDVSAHPHELCAGGGKREVT